MLNNNQCAMRSKCGTRGFLRDDIKCEEYLMKFKVFCIDIKY